MFLLIEKILNKTKKNKLGQAVLESCIILPFFIFFMFAFIDILKFNMVRLEISYYLRKHIVDYVSDVRKVPNKAQIHTQKALSDLQNNTFFCSNIINGQGVHGARAGCDTKKSIDIGYKTGGGAMMVATSQNGKRGVGSQACFAFTYSYKPQPMLQKIFGKEIKNDVVECSIMEYSDN